VPPTTSGESEAHILKRPPLSSRQHVHQLLISSVERRPAITQAGSHRIGGVIPKRVSVVRHISRLNRIDFNISRRHILLV
jgi:hypothetical protein